MAYSKKDKDKIFEEIFSQIEIGKSLKEILKNNKPISRTTFYDWINKDKEKLDIYARACILRADFLFDEILEIADNETRDKSNIAVSRDRLKVDTRKWALSKMNPKKYGDKIDVTSDNEKIEGVKLDLSKLTDEQLDRLGQDN